MPAGRGILPPNSLSALSWHVRQGLEDNFGAALADDSVKAIVLRCAGATFIAGADISEFGKTPPPGTPPLPGLIDALEASPKPVVAAIHGVAMIVASISAKISAACSLTAAAE